MNHKSLTDAAVKAIDDGQLDKLKNIASSIPKDKLSEVLSQCDKNGVTPLSAAIDRRNIACVRYLLTEWHVDPMVKNEKQYFSYPLTRAAQLGDYTIVKMLLKSGAKLNLFDEEGYESPLSVRCMANHEEIARLLIEKGEDIDKSRCLLTAMTFGSNELIKFMLECGADVNISNKDGWTPLIECSWTGNLEILKLLLDKGADHEAICVGLNPIQWAAVFGQENIVYFYLEEEYYTREKVLECIELLGVEALIRDDVNLAVNYWNRELKERSKSKINSTKRLIFEDFCKNSESGSDFNHLIGDSESAAIHAIIVLERIIGIDQYYFFRYLTELLNHIPLENVKVWDTVLEIRNDSSKKLFPDISELIIKKFYIYFRDLKDGTFATPILNLVYKVLNISFEFLQNNKNSFVVDRILNFCVRGFLCLTPIRGTLSIDHKESLMILLKQFLNIKKIITKSIFHKLIETEGFAVEEIMKTLELSCKLAETVNFLDAQNETPLHVIFKRKLNKTYVDIFLKYGAVTDIRNATDETIRELAQKSQDICCGSPSLQILINSRIKDYLIPNNEDLPAIFNHFMKLH